MINKTLAALALIVMVASACTGSAAVTDFESADPRRSAVEPSAPPASDPTSVEATPDPASVPAPTSVSGSESPTLIPDQTTPVVTPQATLTPRVSTPKPPTRLCTDKVDITEELNLRAAPDIDAPIVYGIPGESCRMRALAPATDGWVEVAYETQNVQVSGFVSTDFATVDEPVLAFEWFDRMVGADDTSDIIIEDTMRQWIDFHPFPPTAFRMVSFDDGNPRPCRPVGLGRTGCPVHVLDSNGDLVTPMQIEIGEVVIDGEQTAAVAGFNLCFGTEDCIDVRYDLHDRIVVDDSRSLAGVALGLPADDAIERLVAVFGAPTEDTDWVVGCPLDGEEFVNERYVGWGSLTAGFQRSDSDPDITTFNYWSYRLDETRQADPDGPQPAEIRLPRGAAVGMNISAAAEAVGGELFFNEVLQRQQLNTDAWRLYGAGLEADTRIIEIGVPFIPLCD